MATEEELETKVVIPTFEEMMKDKTFKDSFQSQLDSGISKGVEAYKTGSFKEAVEKGVAAKIEAAKHKTPEQLQIEEMANNMKALQKQLADKEVANIRKDNKVMALKGLTDKGLPSGLIDFVIDDTEEGTVTKLEVMSKVFTDHLQNIKTEKLKNNNIVVPTDSNTTSTLTMPGKDATEADWKDYFSKKGKQ